MNDCELSVHALYRTASALTWQQSQERAFSDQVTFHFLCLCFIYGILGRFHKNPKFYLEFFLLLSFEESEDIIYLVMQI